MRHDVIVDVLITSDLKLPDFISMISLPLKNVRKQDAPNEEGKSEKAKNRC